MHQTTEEKLSDDPSRRIPEVVEWCPICEKEGIKTPAKFFQLNYEEAIFTCGRTQCDFPFAKEYVPLYIKRDFTHMSDPEKTPVVYMTDILSNGAHEAQTVTYLTRSPEKPSQTEVKDPSAGTSSSNSSAGTSCSTNNINTTNSIKTYSTCNPEYASETARKKAEEAVAKIMGDFASVLALFDDSGEHSEGHLPYVRSDVAAKPKPEFEGFVFTCSGTEKSTVTPRRRKNFPFCTKKRKGKKKVANGTK